MIEVIDLFCGAGGVTTGIEKARYLGIKCANVIACINHDPIAIASHAANHKGVLHFTEDIKTFDVTKFPKWSPGAVRILWASLECTNFSIAKGGMPRDADSRTLAEHLFRYISHLQPDYILIENVREFMSWGPLDQHGKPVSKDKGTDYVKWVNRIKRSGYQYDYRILNCADYGAHTSRKRLFICFANTDLPMIFPAATHAKKPAKGLKKWKAVKQVLDFTDEGQSIFTRKKPLSEKTLERIYAGLIKYVAEGDDKWIVKYNSACNNTSVNKGSSVDEPSPTLTTMPGVGVASVDKAFILKYNSTNRDTGKHIPPSIEDPAPVISTQVRMGLVNVNKAFLAQYNSGSDMNRVTGIDDPCNTIPTENRFALVQTQFLVNYNHASKCDSVDKPSPAILTHDKLALASPEFLVKYHKTGKNISSVEDPSSTITTKDRQALIQPKFFIDEQYSNSKPVSVDSPSNAILGNPKQKLVQVDRTFILDNKFNNTGKSINEPAATLLTGQHQYLVNPQWFSSSAYSVNDPCFTLIARMDKAPPYLVQTESGETVIEIYESDSECTVKIKLFMAAYGIIDIKLRMLRIHELLAITGLPKRYKLKGNQSDQKKFIGNAVPPIVPQRWMEALYPALLEWKELKLAA